ncbi:DcaP family trimeric outer membrane transporter [Sphingomonas sp. PP-F2F-A104-K0414]|uniref:DcaP family trimeric outer membrane transporter n=1 Tax=Sphingomonas sp. PP-F2F-A104-K0414 TaxID=2135661 RepID=UPI0032605DCA
MAFKTRLALTALLAGTALVPGMAQAQTAREIELETRLKALEAAVQDLRGELNAARATAAAPIAPTAMNPAPMNTNPMTASSMSVASESLGRSPGATNVAQAKPVAANSAPTDGFRVGNTTVKLGGFVRLNVIASRYSDGEAAVGGLGKEFFLPQQIPVGGGFSTQDLLLSARQTRLQFSTSTPMNGTDIKTLVEFDFALATAPVGAQRATNPYTPTFRRGFIEYGNLLVGQEWSTFQNIAVLPETTDFVGPLDGTVFNRQAQVRYTIPLRSGLTLQIAAENPETETALPANAALVDTDDDRLPDVVARVNWKPTFGDFALAGIARELRTDTLGSGDTAFGWGVSGSGKIPIGKRHDLRFMATYGQGIGRYLGLGYVPDAIYGGTATQLERIDNFAAFAAFRIGWTDAIHSTLMGSYQSANYPAGVIVTGLANAKSYGGAGNLFWSPGKGFDIGVEYRHAVRELVSGDTGALDRLEFAFKYGF